MNTTNYIGYFKEISHLSKSEQEVILDKARHLAFTKYGMSGRYALYLVLSFVLTFVIGIMPALLIDASAVVNSISIGIGFIVSYYLFRHFNGKLIKVGLLDLLNNSNE